MILVGKVGAKQIAEFGSVQNVYTSLRKCEEVTVSGLAQYFDYLKQNGHYEEETDIRGVWSVDKAQVHEITVECFGQTSQTEGFAFNEQDIVWVEQDGSEKEYKMIGGRYEFTIEVKCRSMQRSSVIYLADAVITGLQTNVRQWLSQNNIYIPAMAVKVAQKPIRVQITKDLATWEIAVNVANVSVEWRQIVETTGEILQNISYFINYIENEIN